MMSSKQKEQLIQICKVPESKTSIYSIIALPWCCILPLGISWLGVGSAFLAAILRPMTVPLLATSAVLLGFSHYKVWVQGHRSKPQVFWLTISTTLSVSLWSWSILVMRAVF